MNWDLFFDALITFINESRNPKADANNMDRAARMISAGYLKLKGEKDFWAAMDRDFLNDLELYSLLISAIYYVTQDAECLKKAESLMIRGDIDFFMAAGIQYQVRLNRFRNSSAGQAAYAELRDNNRILLDRLQREYGMGLPYIPYHERHKERIVVMTDALLSRLHAPTTVVLDICEILSTHLGFEVFLAVCVAGTDGAEAQKYCVFPFQAKYLEEYNGDFLLNAGTCKLPAFQILLGKHTMGGFQKLLQRIHDWKPLCVWYVGGNSFWHDVCGRFVTMISMPCTEGYPVSEADVLVSYMRTQGKYLEDARAYITKHGQKMVDIQTGRVYEKREGEYHREDFGIPADAVLLAVVGNRLEDELSEEFLEFMERLAKGDSRIYYAIIGKYGKPVRFPVLKERMVLLGFREDLVNVLEMTDIFLNPPRGGGGGGAARAQAVGKPVVSLKHCDVAAIAGEEFCCDTLGEMEGTIGRYCRDKSFYHEMSQKAAKKYEARVNIDMKEQYGSVIKAVGEWLGDGELK